MTCSAARDQPTHRIASSRATQPKRQISTAPLAHATRMISSRRSPCQDFPLRRRCYRFPNPAALIIAAHRSRLNAFAVEAKVDYCVPTIHP